MVNLEQDFSSKSQLDMTSSQRLFQTTASEALHSGLRSIAFLIGHLGTERRGAMLPWRSKHIHVHSKSRLYWNTQRDGKPNYDIMGNWGFVNSG
ncbi:uncharacterized protein H6S33_003227 [Morchella sextelata]|uniref:uncharacterized protein n=1 Tax=Morchella sextelata TaxID=1174677 RepID=UPI001D039011|nr:uncharacterized protein H6S33_003227 [Morchella sextelata]KAH0607239.1 hypothetical protein H6S33_003227 [Morchella sextelata]